jgi:DNA-binding GntR family transcriptional regulator
MTYAETLGLLKNNSLPSLVQEELEAMLRKGKFSPGDALREAALASQLGVSRGPIREAFRSLEEKGLVKVEKNRGVFVRIISLQEADEIFEVRTALEILIVSRLSKKPEVLLNSDVPALLVKAKKLAAKGDVAGCHALNIQFHQRMAQLAGNETLSNTYQKLVNELSLFRHQAHAAQSNALTLLQSATDHQELFDAITQSNKKQALTILNRHVDESRKRLKKLLKNTSEVEI